MKELLQELAIDFDSILDLMDSFQDIFFLKDGDGRYIRVGGKVHEYLHIDKNDLIGKTNEDLALYFPSLKDFFKNVAKTDEQTWSNEKLTIYREHFYQFGDQTRIFDIFKLPLFYKDGSRKGLLVVGKDKTIVSESQLELANRMKELKDIQFALEQSSIVAITDNKGIITYVNDKFCELSKYGRDELIGSTHRLINSGYHSKSFFKDMWAVIGSGKVWKGVMRNKAKDGSYYWVNTTIVPFLNEAAIPYQYISIRHDITNQKEIEEQILYNAYHDELTGLRNRRCFNYEINSSFQQNKDEKMAFFFIDLDRFKHVNDTLGHDSGDQVLKVVAHRLSTHLKNEVDLYRFGGDEFIAVMKDCSDTCAETMAAKINNLFSTPFHYKGEKIYLSTSIGVSFYPKDGKDLEILVKKADSAMYIGKRSSSNEVQFFTSEMYENLTKMMEMERELRGAIEEKAFHLHYQPQVDLRTQEIVGLEALIRWEHPKWGNISPSEFIPIAEETGLITPITEWVLDSVCRDYRSWLDIGMEPIRLAVNISPNLFQEDLVLLVTRTLEKWKLSSSFLELEMTEGVLQNQRTTIPILQELRALGVRVSIDDFGTGYSSLASLRDFPIDCLKIDRSFMEDIKKDNGIMIKTILDMATHLNVNVIAEGIETKSQLMFLSTLQCSQGQGYLFSRPLPGEEIVKILSKKCIYL